MRFSLWIQQRRIRFCVNLWRKCNGDSGNDWTSVRERKHEPYTESPNLLRPKKRSDRLRANSGACSSFSLTSRDCSQRFRPGSPNSQFRILLWRFTATAWTRVKTSPQIRRQKIWLLHQDNIPPHTSFFIRDFFFAKKNMTVVPRLPYFSFSPTKDKTESAILTKLRWWRHNRNQYWTASQNTTSRLDLNNGRGAENGAYVRKGITSSVMAASRPEIRFWPDGSTSPENYLSLFEILTGVLAFP
jgi:hypothetical protein